MGLPDTDSWGAGSSTTGFSGAGSWGAGSSTTGFSGAGSCGAGSSGTGSSAGAFVVPEHEIANNATTVTSTNTTYQPTLFFI